MKVDKDRMERVLRKLWDSAKGNWVYSTRDADGKEALPAGWIVPSSTGVMGELRDLLGDLHEDEMEMEVE